MINEVWLNDTKLIVRHFEEKQEQEKRYITFEFDVTSEAYHDVTTLLYKNKFHVRIPAKNESFFCCHSNILYIRYKLISGKSNRNVYLNSC